MLASGSSLQGAPNGDQNATDNDRPATTCLHAEDRSQDGAREGTDVIDRCNQA
jgi:hypothetical protein